MLRRSLASACAVATLAALAVAGTATIVAERRGAPVSVPAPAIPIFALVVLAPVLVGLAILWRRPRERVAWIVLAGGLSVSVVMAADALAALWLYHHPGSTAGRWASVVAEEWVALFLWLLALAFTFPDGHLPSRRWRPAAAFAWASSIGIVLLLATTHELDTHYDFKAISPLPFSWSSDLFLYAFWACWFGLVGSLFLGAASLRARYQAGDAQLRRQVLWLAYGALLVPLWLGGGSLVALFLPWPDQLDGVGLAVIQVWPAVALWIAVTRHGLYEIDRILNRTLVYAALTALLAATYAVVVLGAGLVAGRSALAASLATLAAAVAFRPLRDRIQSLVDRRFARARFDAVRLLRGFLDQVRDGRAEPEHVGAVLAVALGDATAEVVFRLPETGAYADADGHLLDGLPDDGRARSPIGRGERELGVLLHDPELARRPDLLRAVLDAAAVPVELARLRVELRLQLAEVESSRERIAQAGYDERRRIERDLHDGAQQRLVTLGIVLRRLQRSLPRGARVLSPAIDAAVDEVAATIADLRTIAAGIRPARLDEGLAAALADLARGAAIPVEVQASRARAPAAIEAAAYFVACEALTNAVKHGSPTRVVLETVQDGDVLHLLVADDGVGGAAPDGGTGIAGMRDRVAAHGGTLAIESPPGAGTRVAVQLPCGS